MHVPATGLRRFVRHAPESIGVFLVVAPWLLAGATAETAMAIAILAFVCLVVIARARSLDEASLARPQVFGVFVFGLAVTALQLVPWPRAVTALVAPHAVLSSRLAYEAAGLPPPSFVPTTLDPGATLRELVKGVALLATVVCVATLRGRKGRTHALRYVLASVVVVALVSAAHAAVGATSVFGLYVPVYGRPLGPLVNPNHLAGFLALGIPIALGFAAESRERGLRASYAALAVFLFVSALLTRSRGGAVAAMIGPVAFAALARVVAPSRAKETPFAGRASRTMALVVSFLAIAVAAFLYVVGGELPTDFHDTDVSKLQLAKGGLALALEHPFVGVGRGAFASAFTALEGTSERYTHPENLVAQWASEWGFPAALLVAAGLGRALYAALVGVRSRVHLGAVAGLFALVLQNLVDFSLEMIGIACVAAATLAALEPSASRSSAVGADVPARRPVRRDAPLVALVLVAAALAPLVVAVDTERLVRRLREPEPIPRDALASEGRVVARFHPNEPSLFLLLGARGIAVGHPYAMRCLNRVMELAPKWSSPHVVAAAWFYRHGPEEQARLEVREAETLSGGWAGGLACALIARKPDEEAVFQMAPHRNPNRARFLANAAACPATPPLLAETIDSLLLREPTVLPSVLLREAGRREARHDAAGARAIGERLVRAAPRDAEGYIVLARSLDVDRALVTLREAEPRVDQPARLLVAQAELATKNGRADAMRDAVDRLRALDAGSGPAQARALMLLGRLESELGNRGKAIAIYRDADALDPASGGLVAAAATAAALGQEVVAAQLYSIACSREDPGSPACTARDSVRERIRAAAQAGTAP